MWLVILGFKLDWGMIVFISFWVGWCINVFLVVILKILVFFMLFFSVNWIVWVVLWLLI